MPFEISLNEISSNLQAVINILFESNFYMASSFYTYLALWFCASLLENVWEIEFCKNSAIFVLTGNKDTHGINSMRLAEVWMDEYKRLFYMHRRDLLVSWWVLARLSFVYWQQTNTKFVLRYMPKFWAEILHDFRSTISFWERTMACTALQI